MATKMILNYEGLNFYHDETDWYEFKLSTYASDKRVHYIYFKIKNGKGIENRQRDWSYDQEIQMNPIPEIIITRHDPHNWGQLGFNHGDTDKARNSEIRNNMLVFYKYRHTRRHYNNGDDHDDEDNYFYSYSQFNRSYITRNGKIVVMHQGNHSSVTGPDLDGLDVNDRRYVTTGSWWRIDSGTNNQHLDFVIENGELEVTGFKGSIPFDTRDRHVDKWRKKKSDLESSVRSIENNKNNKISEKNRLDQRIAELIRTNNTKALERDTAIKNQKAINDDLVIKKNELLGNKKRLQDKLEFFRTGIGGDEYIQLIKDFIAASPGYLTEIKEMVNRVKTRNNNIKESDKIPINELHTTTFGKINVIDVKSFDSNNKFLDLYDNFHADYLCKHEHAGVYIIKNVSLSKLYDYGLSDITGDIKKKTKRIYGLTHKNDNINEILEYANSTKTGNSREGIRQIDNADVSKLFVSDPLNAEMDLLLYPYMKWKNNNQDDPYNLLEYNDPANFNKEEITCILIVEGDKQLQTVTQTIIIYPLLITAVRTLNLKAINYNDDSEYEFDPEDLNIRYNTNRFRLIWRTYNGFNKTWREWDNLNLPWKKWERYTGNEIPNI